MNSAKELGASSAIHHFGPSSIAQWKHCLCPCPSKVVKHTDRAEEASSHQSFQCSIGLSGAWAKLKKLLTACAIHITHSSSLWWLDTGGIHKQLLMLKTGKRKKVKCIKPRNCRWTTIPDEGAQMSDQQRCPAGFPWHLILNLHKKKGTAKVKRDLSKIAKTAHPHEEPMSHLNPFRGFQRFKQ